MAMIASTLQPTKSPGTRFSKERVPTETIIIGAGLSKAFGLPLAGELLPMMVDWHADRAPEKLEMVLEFLEFFYPSFVRSTGNFPLAEDVLGMLDTAEAYSEIRGSGRGYKWREGRVEAIRSRFNRLMGEYLWNFQGAFFGDGLHNLDALKRYVRDKGSSVVYITFNYDLLLETALSCEGITFSYMPDRDSDFVTVLKPHGSINWFLKINGKPPTNYLNWLDHGQNISVCTTLDPRELRFPNKKWKEAALITPTPNKQIQLEELKRVWTAFSSSITAAPVITVIGYSLPDADRMARLVLHRAGPVHSKSRRITIVNPANVELTFKNTISHTATL